MYVGLPGSSSDVSDEYVAMKSKYLGIVQMCATRQESRGVVREAVGEARGDRSVKRRRKQQHCDGEGRVLGKWPVISPAMKSAFKRKDLRMCTSRYSESVFHSPLRMIIVRSCYASFCKGSILVQGSLTDCKCPARRPGWQKPCLGEGRVC